MLTRKSYIHSPVEIKLELLRFFKKDEVLVIFDIGACEAEDSIRYANLFPKSKVYAFEPRVDNFAKAKQLVHEYSKKNILLENIALSNENGTAEFYLSEGEPRDLKNNEDWDYGNKSSSLLPPSKEMKVHAEWLSFNKKIEVKTKRLHDYVSDKNISGIDFMHLDVQGAELMVLQGAGNFLQYVKLIWMEVEQVKLYEDQPVKDDIERFMKSHGFLNILDTVNYLSGDQLYVNKELISANKIKAAQAARKRLHYFSRLKSFFKLN